ncbi:MAG: hypothetical protein FWD61_08405 [Phycisphaerales bacterium]|nr:hypothetical protein [Phycisphaerales bacterium]
MTLADYAAFRGKHSQAVRNDYRDLMRSPMAPRQSRGLTAVTRRSEDPIDGTLKFCLSVGVHNDMPLESESVIIPMTSFGGKRWYTLCVSSQVGCRMGCGFCETGRMGLLANLTPAQIVQQRLVARVLRLESREARSQKPVARSGQPPSGSRLQASGFPPPASRGYKYFSDGIQNIVFMGMGEPLDNYENLIQAIRVLSEPAGLDFPLAQITVSTVGRIDGLRKLAALCRSHPLWRNLRIAISLNAATDTLRDQLMPINRAMPLKELKRALLDYPLGPKGRFLIEYVVIKDINHSSAAVAAVADFCDGIPCIVNLIPYNPCRSQHFAAYQTPDDAAILGFMTALKSRGLFVKRRTAHGRDLMSACGQLGNPQQRSQKSEARSQKKFE